MPAAERNIEIDQGSLYYPVFTWKDINGNPVDISGWSGKMDIRERQSKDSDLIKRVSTATSNFTIDGPNGIFRPKILATESNNWDFAWAYYDIELTPPAGEDETRRVVQGKVRLNKQTTD